MKNTLTKKEIIELQKLLCSWEDGNISDYKYCNKAGKILGLGNWTWKGSKKHDDKNKPKLPKMKRRLSI